MSRRTPETLADYLVVGITPALIMVLIGSLVFFLIEVFYEGEFRLRLMWVMAMFILGVVCTSRIAMEDGAEYATLFALPLGGVVALALMRFVPGGLAIGLPLMALTWWSAYKLTWDCTLIDDTQDASGQGLLQHMGLEEGDPSATAANAGVTTSGPVEATTSADDGKLWWQRWLEPDRRPHTPGVWVVYFSLAALPLFGIGGWFVPASNAPLRTRVFLLLAIYVAAGLSLLVATSFLGLRRYLRQRRLEMPLDMAATWVFLGAMIIIFTLLVALILPRPHSEHSLASVPGRITSAVRNASRYAVGPEGTPDDRPDAATTQAQKGQQAKRHDGRGEPGEKSAAGDDRGKSQSKGNGKSQGKSSGKSQGDTGGKSDRGKEGGADSQSKSQDAAGKTSTDRQGPSDSQKSHASEKSQSGEGQSGQSGNRQGERSPQKGDSSDDRSQDSSDRQPSEREPPDQQPSEPQSAEDQSVAGQRQQPPQPQETGSSSPPNQQSSPTGALSNFLATITQSLGTLLKWIFYAALLLIGLVLAWKYREQLAAAWRKLLEELRQLWAGWFGGDTKAEESPATVGAAPRPFSAFSDPFLTGAADRMAWPELVRYTFDAVEAWAREHGTPRHPDQTPLEFAQSLAIEHPGLDRHLRTLATWYGQLAYARAATPSGSAEPLRELWHGLDSHRAAIVLAGDET